MSVIGDNCALGVAKLSDSYSGSSDDRHASVISRVRFFSGVSHRPLGLRCETGLLPGHVASRFTQPQLEGAGLRIADQRCCVPVVAKVYLITADVPQMSRCVHSRDLIPKVRERTVVQHDHLMAPSF